MKILNKITETQLESLSEGAITRNLALLLFDFNDNSSNGNEINPNIYEYGWRKNDDWDSEGYGYIALHLGGDVRCNYSDYYILPIEEIELLVADKLDLLVKTKEDLNNIKKFLKTHAIKQKLTNDTIIQIDLSHETLIIDGVIYEEEKLARDFIFNEVNDTVELAS